MKRLFYFVVVLLMLGCKSNSGKVSNEERPQLISGLPQIEEIGQHEYVDLGLSVKWATCNVGATSPEEYGDYLN